MTLINPIDSGMAGSSSEQFETVVLVTGDFPIFDESEKVAASVIATADLPALTVVGYDANGELVPAVEGSVDVIGITVNTVKAGTSGEVAVYKTGCFNPDALVWDSSFTTDAQKREAFAKVPKPLFLRKAVTE